MSTGRMRQLIALALLAGSAAACPPDPTPCGSTPTAPACSTPSPTGAAVLPIPPIAQQTVVWCWAATAEMVFRHFQMPNLNGFGNYQCGIVAAYFGGACLTNCGLCVSTIQSMSELQRLINQYGLVARQLGIPSPGLTSRLLFRALSIDEIAAEIDANRPIVAGITANGFPFPNFSQHVTVIVGYDATGATPAVIVNDPFPYDLPQFAGYPNPYREVGAVQVQPGRYRVPLLLFIQRLNWANTIYDIRRTS